MFIRLVWCFIKSNKIPHSRNSADARLVIVRRIRPNHDKHREPVVCRGYWCRGGGRPTTGMGRTKDGLGCDPIAYPTDMPFRSKTKHNVEPVTSSNVGPKRLGIHVWRKNVISEVPFLQNNINCTHH